MDADVDQRLSMSLDDLIKSQKKAAPAAGAKQGGGAASANNNVGGKAAAGKKAGGRRQRGAAKGKPAAAAPAAGAAAAPQGQGKKRGGRPMSKALGVKVKTLKNAPVHTDGHSHLSSAALCVIYTAASDMLEGG